MVVHRLPHSKPTMNKQLLSLTMLALVPLLSGCTAADSADASWEDGTAVYFRTTASDMTRAVVGGTFTDDETFRVFATSESGGTRQVFIPDDGTSNVVSYGLVIPDASYNSAYYGMRGWHTQTPYYWNDEDTYNFYAVHPASAPNITASEGDNYTTVALSYEVPATAGQDLLYATKVGERRNTVGVALTFHHALCRVTIGKTEENGVTLLLNSITLKNIKHSGTFNFGTAAWTADNGICDYSYGTTLDGELLLLPQTLADNALITVSYKILAEDGSYVQGSENEWAEKDIVLSGEWLADRTYHYSLTANFDIRLSVSIDPWSEGVGDSSGFEL